MSTRKDLNEFLEGHLNLRPAEGTALGYKKYDGRMEDISPIGRSRQQNFYRHWLHRSRALARSAKGEAAMDLDGIGDLCRFNLHLLSHKEHGFSPELALDFFEDLQAQHLRVEGKKEKKALAARLNAAQEFFSDLSKNIASVAGEKSRPEFDRRYLRDVLACLKESSKELNGGLARTYGAPARACSASMRKLAHVIKTKILPGARESYAIGEQEYSFRMRTALGEPRPPRALFKEWKGRVKDLNLKMRRMAKRIAPKDSLEATMARLNKAYPKTDAAALKLYHDLTARAQRFVANKKLFDVLPGYELRLEPIPAGLGEALTTAIYFCAPPFDHSKKGVFLVALGRGDTDKLKAHNPYHAAATTVHEAFPGHDMQFFQFQKLSKKIPPVRFLRGDPRNFGESMNTEGYAHYAEELMRRYGFFTPEEELFALGAQAWRAARVVIDIGLHCKWMSFQQAVKYLSDNAGLDPKTSRGEVFRYTKWPTQAVTYALGKQTIERLKRNQERRLGRRFSESAFHKKFLSFGPLKPALIERQLANGH